jgi:tyrosine-protein kinase Etk/Wzc
MAGPTCSCVSTEIRNNRESIMQAAPQKEFHLLDYVDFIVKRKEMFVGVFVLSLIITFIAVFFLIEEQYEATAVLIPRSDEGASTVGNLLRNVKGVSLGLGGKSPKSETDLYTTIIYSRTMMEDLIKTFDLVAAYHLDSTRPDFMEQAVKRLRGEVFTKETEESAYLITVRAGTRERAAAMTNALVQKMNERIVDLKVSRSKENREFIGRRVDEVRETLRVAEDSLRVYQERSGLLDTKAQIQGIIEAHTTLESELAARRIQRGILEQMYDKESPQVREAQMQISAYEKKLKEMRVANDPGSPLLALKGLPKTAAEFLRRYREVEINSLLLEFIMPLHEQAKIEEKKDYPVLQVIDDAIPPAKKSYPPRTLFALIGAFSVTFLVFVVLRLRLSLNRTTDSRVLTLVDDIKRWSWSSWRLKP